MRRCSFYRKLRVVLGRFEDYSRLAHYHYRDSRPGPFEAIFTLKAPPDTPLIRRLVVGVIVYSMPSPRLEIRNLATDNYYAGLDKNTKLSLINRDIRRISRIIIEPRFRGLSLASRLVRETMPQMNVPVIEAMAVMGLVNPFLEKAGMKAYPIRPPAGSVRLIEAFSIVGIEENELIDTDKVQQKLDRLDRSQTKFLEQQIKYFLKSHGQKRNHPPGLERTKYILSKLTPRGIYYIWFNENQGAGDREY
jgi:hypothetical protein